MAAGPTNLRLSPTTPFPAPARRTVHAVLPHTALRRCSPPACGQPRQTRGGSGGSIDLGRPVKRLVQALRYDMVVLARRHSPTRFCTTTRQRSRGPSLTGGSVVRSAQSVLWPPPTPFRHSTHFPVIAGYRVRRSGRDTRVRAGEGLPSSRRHLLTIPRPVRRRVLHGCFQALHRFHGLHLEVPGSALSASTRRWPPHDAAGFALCYGLVSCSPLLGF